MCTSFSAVTDIFLLRKNHHTWNKHWLSGVNFVHLACLAYNGFVPSCVAVVYVHTACYSLTHRAITC